MSKKTPDAQARTKHISRWSSRSFLFIFTKLKDEMKKQFKQFTKTNLCIKRTINVE